MGHTPVVPGNRSLRQRYGELKVSLSYLVRLGLRNKRGNSKTNKATSHSVSFQSHGNHGTVDLWVPS